jgi:hypothetical protein
MLAGGSNNWENRGRMADAVDPGWRVAGVSVPTVRTGMKLCRRSSFEEGQSLQISSHRVSFFNLRRVDPKIVAGVRDCSQVVRLSAYPSVTGPDRVGSRANRHAPCEMVRITE